jgi:hypothetical protein
MLPEFVVSDPAAVRAELIVSPHSSAPTTTLQAFLAALIHRLCS